MRVGINVSDLDHDRMIEYAVRAEDRGLDSVWVGETWGWEAFTVLGELAVRTDDVTLGTGIVPVYSRSPALLGQAAATMNEAADGRFALGVGASGPAVIEHWHGTSFDRPVGRTAETISIVKSVLSGETVSHDGTDFSLDGFRLRIQPDERDVPVYVGAMGTGNVRMAGAVADGWMPIFVPRSRLKTLLAEFRDSATGRGRDPESLAVAPNTVTAISEDRERAAAAVSHHVAFYVGAMGDFYHRMLSDSGYGEAADEIRDAWHGDGPDAAAAAVPSEVLEETAVVGTPEEAAAKLDAFDELGADEVHLFFPRSADPDLMTETIEHLGDYR